MATGDPTITTGTYTVWADDVPVAPPTPRKLTLDEILFDDEETFAMKKKGLFDDDFTQYQDWADWSKQGSTDWTWYDQNTNITWDYPASNNTTNTTIF